MTNIEWLSQKIILSQQTMDLLLPIFYFLKDGWTASDVNYTWKIPDPVQFVKHIQMPGGFELYNHTNKRCDVRTTTGKLKTLDYISALVRNLNTSNSIDIILP